jgi:hypothetical protein
MHRFVLFLATALFMLTAAGPSSAKPAAGAPGGYTLVENARLVEPGHDSPTAAETISTGDPFTWGAVASRSRRASGFVN